MMYGYRRSNNLQRHEENKKEKAGDDEKIRR
jgi:hypothetical protein